MKALAMSTTPMSARRRSHPLARRAPMALALSFPSDVALTHAREILRRKGILVGAIEEKLIVAGLKEDTAWLAKMGKLQSLASMGS